MFIDFKIYGIFEPSTELVIIDLLQKAPLSKFYVHAIEVGQHEKKSLKMQENWLKFFISSEHVNSSSTSAMLRH